MKIPVSKSKFPSGSLLQPLTCLCSWSSFRDMILWFCFSFGAVILFQAQVNVFTRSYDNNRSGANLNETILTPSNVTASQFGKLFTIRTDGEIFAQPLYVSQLKVGGSTHNVVFAATMRDSIYAIDGDTGEVLWERNYDAAITPKDVETDGNISWSTGIGILSTPVIDPETNIMYFVSGYETDTNGTKEFGNHLNAIDIATGTPEPGSPVNITATYKTADLTTPLVINIKRQNQRASLALSRGNVYICYASHEDQTPYQGWVLAYNKSTLAQVATFTDTTIGTQGGIWMAGQAPAVDASGNLYISTGNGSFGETPNKLVQTGNSFIKLSPDLQLLDYFTPKNSASLNTGDMDLGASGILLVPNTSYALGGGKQGVIYLTDTSNLGKFNASEDQVIQEFQAVYGVGTSHIHGTPVYFNSEVNGPSFYVWGENDVLRGFRFDAAGGLINPKPFGTSSMTAPIKNNDGAMPGGFLSVSANGAKNGVVWASTPYLANALWNNVRGVVYAFDAETLQPLWSDKDNDARDEIGMFAKYTPPTVANGKVYMATFGPNGTTDGSGALVVYGLLPQLTVNVANASFTAGATQLPALTGTVTGLRNGDTLGSTISVSYSTTATVKSEPGQYPITATVSGSSVDNYRVVVQAGTLTISPQSPTAGEPAVYFTNGFAAANLQLNGNAEIASGRLRLTSGSTWQAGSVFYKTPVNCQSFTNDFTFQFTSANADGIAFVIQNAGPTALGGGGGALGYGPQAGVSSGIGHSLAVKFDLYNNAGEGTDSTGTFVNGQLPTVPAQDLSSSGLNLHSGDQFQVHEVYDGTNLVVTITDLNTGKAAKSYYKINIPGTVGGNTAYIGFTGATGGLTATQDIVSWVYAPEPHFSTGFPAGSLNLNGAALNGTNLRLTDGKLWEAHSAFFPTKVNVQEFTSSFSFQLTNATADGFAFVIQNAGPSVVGSMGGGLGYGLGQSGQIAQIPHSAGIKFDLYDNAGEGPDSTGLYTGGASPTIPAINLSGTGIDLHSGDPFTVTLTYNGVTLTEVITDTTTKASVTETYDVDIPSTVGGPTAYVGFTAGTGGYAATQDIHNWSFSSLDIVP